MRGHKGTTSPASNETLAIRLNTLFTNGLGIYIQLHVSVICNNIRKGWAGGEIVAQTTASNCQYN
jgi:hypothetical protein